MLLASYTNDLIEAGCDEAGRGCLAGPVFAAAVILPATYKNKLLNDSKKISPDNREKLRKDIQKKAIAWAVAEVSNKEIDRINILNASIAAMHKAIKKLKVKPQLLLIDGNRFKKYDDIPHKTIVGGDGLYMSIAAASILAKTYRDEYMIKLDKECPAYHWGKNKGYPTEAHYEAIQKEGISIHHRRTFNLNPQIKLEF
ncbi:MAG TPA: ribonuclease HII [Bacteroidales bacterium]|nr:ribonuclease HII [Bacteroidales bacterium]HPS15934.1 ribonuclease HII [Bacteroidales bacterium]